MKPRTKIRAMVATAALVGVLAAAPAAMADTHPEGDPRPGDDAHHVVARGDCSGESHWRLVLIERHRVILVGFQVQSGVAGEIWRVRIGHNGHTNFLGFRKTNDHGSFGVRSLARNTRGPDHFRAGARNVTTGETCLGRAAI